MVDPSGAEERPDLYQVLGLPPDASRADIVRAYRQQARAVHPDAHPADPGASDRFRALTQAYEVLGDPARKDAYDHRRSSAAPPPRPAPGPPPGAARPRPRPPAWPSPGPGVPLWAGPVHVEPPPGSPRPAAFPGYDQRHLAEAEAAAGTAALLAYLVGRYLAGEDWTS
jgi:curved DNA-binding protein CbpA